MAFVLKKSATYLWPVSYSTPSDGGKRIEHKIDFRFRLISESELKSLLESEGTDDKSFSKAVVVGFEGVVDEAGQAIQFTSQSLDDLLDMPLMAKSVVTAYLQSITEVKQKN